MLFNFTGQRLNVFEEINILNLPYVQRQDKTSGATLYPMDMYFA
jgi:hypothetical protein